MRFRKRLLVGALAVLAGCGGGGGGPAGGGGVPAGPGGEQTLNIGNFVTRVSGTTQQPISVSGYGATVTGVAGGTVSSLTLSNPTPTPGNSPQTLAQSRILFNRGGQIYVMGANGGSPLALSTGLTSVDGRPTWSPDGSKIVFSAPVTSINHYQIFTMNANGSGVTRISDGTNDDLGPAWTSVGNKVAFYRQDFSGHNQIYTMNYNGTSVYRVSDGTSDDDSPTWSPAGDKIAFVRNSSPPQIYVANADGSAVHLLTSKLATSSLRDPAWSPDGTKIAMFVGAGGYDTLSLVSADGLDVRALTSGSVYDNTPAWSPDGTKLAFTRFNTTTHLHQICTVNLDGTSAYAITDGSGGGDTAPSWSPYVQSRKLVGSGGLALSSAGFIAGQQGNNVTSVVVFNATTPNTAFLTTPATLLQGQPSLAITVTADLLTSLVFVNNFSYPASTILGGTTTATGAVVTFNANDGTVSTVLPFNANKAAVTGGGSERKGDELILRRSFIGVWDSLGKNRAPGGASEVRVNARNGQLISFR